MMNCKSVKTEELFEDLSVGAVSLFGAMRPAQLETLWQYLEVRQYSPSQQIFQQQELPSAIYVVVSGKVDFFVERAGVLAIEACYEAGKTFGESAFLGIQPHIGTAQVRSTGPAELFVLTRDALIDIQQAHGELFALLMMNLAREVSRKYHANLTDR